MAIPGLEWLRRHRARRSVVVIVVLLAVIGAESFVLVQQRALDRAVHVQSARLLAQFLHGDTAEAAVGRGVNIRLQNVRFKWSDRVYVDSGNMSVTAVPDQGSVVDFDNLESFHLVVQKSVVLLRPDVLEGMFNESVFNYPGSRLRELKVKFTKDDQGRHTLELSGHVNMGVWIPFTMSTRLAVDTATNTLVIQVDYLKVFKILPATKLLRWTPFHLERLITMPPNSSLLVDGNRLMVKPMGLFPPPRINGKMSTVDVDDQEVRLGFAGAPIPAPEFTAPNYIYLRGGVSQFGHFRMVGTDVLILDRDTTNAFGFSLQHFAEQIPKSLVEVHDTKSVRITMPDY